MLEGTPVVEWEIGWWDDEGSHVAGCHRRWCFEHYSGHTNYWGETDEYVTACRISEDRWRVIVHMSENGEWRPDGKGNYTAECVGEIRYERWADGLWPDVRPMAEERFLELMALDNQSTQTAIENLRNLPR